MISSLVVGGSAGLGRALAEELARIGHHLFLVASDRRDLEPLATDLRLRFGVQVHVMAVNLTEIDPQEFRQVVLSTLGQLDNIFLIAGQSTTFDRGHVDDLLAQRLLEVNLSAPLRVVNAFLDDLAKRPKGNLVAAGSVASIRARRNNAIYGAAKTGWEFYCQAIRHHLAGTGICVQFYRLGFLATRMTFGQQLPVPALSPSEAARIMVAGLGQYQGVTYLPKWWMLIALVLRSLPWFIYRRLDL